MEKEVEKVLDQLIRLAYQLGIRHGAGGRQHVTYRPTSLTARLAQIDAEADARVAEGCIVFRLTTDESHWNEFGVNTAADLDAYLDAEDAKEARKAAYCRWDDYDPYSDPAWIAEMEAEEAAARRRYEEREAEKLEDARFVVFNHYQPGWA